MPEWLHDVAINPPVFGALPDIDDFLDFGEGTVDFAKGVSDGFNKALSEFEKNLFEMGVKSSLLPQTKAVKIVGLFINGLKLLKLLVGGDEEGGGATSFIGSFNLEEVYAADPDFPVSQLFLDLAKDASFALSRIGVTVMDPTFFADPAVGGG